MENEDCVLQFFDPTDDDFHEYQINTETFDLTPLVEIMKKSRTY